MALKQRDPSADKLTRVLNQVGGRIKGEGDRLPENWVTAIATINGTAYTVLLPKAADAEALKSPLRSEFGSRGKISKPSRATLGPAGKEDKRPVKSF